MLFSAAGCGLNCVWEPSRQQAATPLREASEPCVVRHHDRDRSCDCNGKQAYFLLVGCHMFYILKKKRKQKTRKKIPQNHESLFAILLGRAYFVNLGWESVCTAARIA